jgi:hypothetical protein
MPSIFSVYNNRPYYHRYLSSVPIVTEIILRIEIEKVHRQYESNKLRLYYCIMVIYLCDVLHSLHAAALINFCHVPLSLHPARYRHMNAAIEIEKYSASSCFLANIHYFIALSLISLLIIDCHNEHTHTHTFNNSRFRSFQLKSLCTDTAAAAQV